MPLRPLARLLAPVGALLLVGAAAQPVSAATADPLTGDQWALTQVNAEQAWSLTRGAGAVVAVVDSGVDLTHPDLRANLVPGITTTGCAGGASYCSDGNWIGTDGVGQELDHHGTHVSGIIAAVADNGLGIAGVAPEAKVMPIKSLEDGSGSFEEIANGITWAVDHGADVVNLSLGAMPGVQALTLTGLLSDVTDAIAYATANGVQVVAAAGNESFPVCGTPAFEPGALCVTSTTREETPSWFSNGAVKPDLDAVAAPGGAGLFSCEDDIVSTVPVGTGSAGCGQSDYDYYAGTSMATPYVAGIAALLASQGRDRENLHAALIETARTPVVGTGVFTTSYGHGIVDAAAAVAQPGAASQPVAEEKPQKGKKPKKPKA